MRLTAIPSAIAGMFETRIRQARFAHRQARLRRELSQLPSYIAVETNSKRFQGTFEKSGISTKIEIL